MKTFKNMFFQRTFDESLGKIITKLSILVATSSGIQDEHFKRCLTSSGYRDCCITTAEQSVSL